jgi:hypothetical protein
VSDFANYTQAMLNSYRRNATDSLVASCCPNKCADSQYDYRVVVSEDTSQAMQSHFDLSDNLTKSRMFTGRVVLYWRTGNVEVIEDQYSYGFTQFVGELGGTWGLFLGVSIISVLELIEHLFKAVLALRNHKCTRMV